MASTSSTTTDSGLQKSPWQQLVILGMRTADTDSSNTVLVLLLEINCKGGLWEAHFMASSFYRPCVAAGVCRRMNLGSFEAVPVGHI